MDWEMDPRGGGRSNFFWLAPLLALLHILLAYSSSIPPPFFFFLSPQEGSSAELEREKQTFFLHLIRQLHQPQAPHLPGFHSDYTKHTMTSAGMTSAL